MLKLETPERVEAFYAMSEKQLESEKRVNEIIIEKLKETHDHYLATLPQRERQIAELMVQEREKEFYMGISYLQKRHAIRNPSPELPQSKGPPKLRNKGPQRELAVAA